MTNVQLINVINKRDKLKRTQTESTRAVKEMRRQIVIV